jgi:hypothetical protein
MQFLSGKKSNIIAEITISSNCDYVDFTGLDSDIDGGYILECAIVNNASQNGYYSLFVNGDTNGSNYSYQRLGVEGSTVSGVSGNSAPICFSIPSDKVNIFVNIKIIGGLFRYISLGSTQYSGGVHGDLIWGRKSATITKITSLRVSVSQTNGIGAGSKFILKKIRE